jgi:hypothetical protein
MGLKAPVGDGATLAVATDPSMFSTTLITKLEDFKLPPFESAKVATTKIDDTAGTKQPGIPTLGACDVTVRHSNSISTTLTGYQTAKTMLWFKATLNDAGTITNPGTQNGNYVFTGFIGNYDPAKEIKINTEILSSFQIEGSGTILVNSTY